MCGFKCNLKYYLYFSKVYVSVKDTDKVRYNVHSSFLNIGRVICGALLRFLKTWSLQYSRLYSGIFPLLDTPNHSG
jgi:hypothetical protein